MVQNILNNYNYRIANDSFYFFTLKLSLNCLLTDRITYALPIHFWSACDSSAILIVFTYLLIGTAVIKNLK